MLSTLVRGIIILLVLAGSLCAQNPASAVQLLVLDNDQVRILRITLPAQAKFPTDSTSDTVAVRLADETATFIPKGTQSVRDNPTDKEIVDLLIQPKHHWDPPVRPCAEPMRCTRETRMGKETIAWTTTLFTNGFLTGTVHRVIRGGTLDSSYYSAKGSDQVVVIPFTDMSVNFGGIDEARKAGQPYFSTASEVEVTGTNAEARWFVLRLNVPAK